MRFGHIFDPCDCRRIWTVEEKSFSGGSMRCFWFLSNAQPYAEKSEAPFVDLRNEITGECIRIKGNGFVERPMLRP